MPLVAEITLGFSPHFPQEVLTPDGRFRKKLFRLQNHQAAKQTLKATLP